MAPQDHILLVDDEPGLRKLIAASLEAAGYWVSQAGNGDEAMELLAGNVFQAVVTELTIPGQNGLELLSHVQENFPHTPVIITTEYGSVESAVQAMKQGAFDFMEKPLNLEHLILTIRGALKKASLSHAYDYLRREQPYIYRIGDIQADSPSMKKVLEQATRVAPTDATVMLTGESGTGKTLIAGAIHANSPRRDENLVSVNCAALTETLLESELFGHEKGAFTGAHKARAGRIQQAHGGTLLLDELGDMSLTTQAKILQAMEERVIQRVGGSRLIHVDVRILAATNRDLSKALESGEFRQDLYYRLNVARIELPPLRDRKEDIVPLAQLFMTKISKEFKKPDRPFSKKAVEIMLTHPWPGNIRELRNAVERALLFSKNKEIMPADLGLTRSTPQGGNPLVLNNLNLDDLEKTAIVTALEKSDWVQSRAAKLLGVSPRALVYKISKYSITHPALEARKRSR